MTWPSPAGSPWADPATPTEPGLPYAGPPPTVRYHGAPPVYGYPPLYGNAPWGAVAVPWAPLPTPGPRRPGQLIGAAVLAFVQALVVVIVSLYLWLLASAAGAAVAEVGAASSPTVLNVLADDGVSLAFVQLVSAVALVAAGSWALASRRRAAWVGLVGALAVQVGLAIHWFRRLDSLLGGLGTVDGPIASVTLFFVAAPLVGLGLLLIGPCRRWFGGTPQG